MDQTMILESSIGTQVTINGRKHVYFGGNNYLGLAGHPFVKEAAIKAIEKFGVNFSASRVTTGTSSLHLELERELSLFKGKEDTVVFASGYQGNGILLESLRDDYSVILADRMAHASIVAGVPRDGEILYYNHRDTDHLNLLLDQQKLSVPLVITDGIFALTGEIAPLDNIFPVVRKHNGLLVSDDAHSTGILGSTGKGTPEHFNFPADGRIFQTETMSKALGAYGGFISGSRELTGRIRKFSATYRASTALPPPIVAAGIAALRIIRENPGLRIELLRKAGWLREEILRLGFQTSGDQTPIIPLFFASPEIAENLSRFLEEYGIIVPYMHYPSAENMHLLRIAVTVEHSERETGLLLEMLKKWKTSQGFTSAQEPATLGSQR